MDDDADQTTSSTRHENSYVPFPTFSEWRDVRFDSVVFDNAEQRLSARRSSSSADAFARAVEFATRSAAVDTGAIEGLYSTDRGFTRTVATQAAAWRLAAEARGAQVLPAISDALDAYEYVLNAASESWPITELWIRELHQIICRSQTTYAVHTAIGTQEQPLPKGIYKSMPNSPTNLTSGEVHHYAPVLDTPGEMGRFVAEINSEDFLSAQPVLQAAYAHYAYVCVHPFADGNGRVARALASVYLYRRPGVPLVVFADQREQYLDALESADAGRFEPFVNFMEARAVDTIGIILATVQNDGPSASASLAAITASLHGNEAVEMGAAATRLMKAVHLELENQLSSIGPSPVRWTFPRVGSVPPPSGHVLGSDQAKLSIFAQVAAPADVRIVTAMAAFVRTTPEEPELTVVCRNGTEPLDVALREIEPVITEVLNMKIAGWVEGLIATILARVAATTKANLGR